MKLLRRGTRRPLGARRRQLWCRNLHRLFFYALALHALGLLGCARQLAPVHKFPNGAPLLAQAALQHSSLDAISGEARIDQRGEQGRIRGTVLLYATRSGQVRFDVMTQFGPVLTLTSDGQRFALTDVREGRFLHGPTCPRNISRLLQLPLSARQVTAVLLGGIPDVLAERTELTWQPSRGSYRIIRTTTDGSSLRVDITLHPDDEQRPLAAQRLRVLALEMRNAAGETLWRADYGEHGPVADQRGVVHQLPQTVRMTHRGGHADTVIKCKAMTANPAIPEGVFSQTPPGGIPVEEAHCD